MPDIEKVIKETKDGIAFAESRGFGGLANTMRDALALLKEQEDLGTELTNAVELIHKKNERIEKLLKEQEAVYPSWQNGKMYCGHCGSKFPPRVGMRFCHRCGMPIKLKVNDIVEQKVR